MPRVRLAAVPLLAGLLPLTAGALGLGEITLRSALNQPFRGEIPVTAASAEELAQLNVQLAPAATFERFGLDRPGFLQDLRFSVEREGGRALVLVTSVRPVSEPFVSLLLEVSWPQGRLLREYTVLLDPPAFATPDSPSSPAPRQAAPAAPVAAGPAPAPEAIQRAPAPASTGSAPASSRLTTGPDGDVYGPVQANETLWAIAERLRSGTNLSINQMMIALYRANPEAFAGNINWLRRGAILRVPPAGEAAALPGREAAAEVSRQDEEWRSGAAAAPARLQLVPPGEQTPAGSGVAGDPARVAALEQELNETRRLLSLRDRELKALQDQAARPVGESPTAPDAAAVVPPAPQPVEIGPEAAPEAAITEPQVADAETEAPAPVASERQTADRPVRERPSSQAEGSFLETVIGLVFNVWFLVSAAVVLLAGLFFVFARRRMAASEVGPRFGNDLRGGMVDGAARADVSLAREGYSVEEDVVDRTQALSGSARGQAAGLAGDAELPLERTISAEGGVELDQADVVAEADFHMAYGLYDQAAELLNRALRDSPGRRDLRLKLLEVYFIWENKAAFLKEAQAFQRQLPAEGHPDWNKVVIMGKQICPGEALFAGAVESPDAGGLDLALADDSGGDAVDVSFDLGDEAGLDLDLSGISRSPAANDLLDFNFDSPDDTGLTPTEIVPGRAGDARTTEVPTIEAPAARDGASTMETPTLESRGIDASTMETPTIETPSAGTLETPTLESAATGLGAPSRNLRGPQQGSDHTEEINLEELGLDLAGLDAAAGDLGTGVHGALDARLEDDDGSDGDVFDLGSMEDEGSGLLEGLEADSTAEVRGMSLDEGTLDLPAFGTAMKKSSAARDSLRETASHRVVDDTAEQPVRRDASLGDVSAELTKVDFDIGDDPEIELEPTSVMTGRRKGPDGPTMTEVGTKLDLARAYVDMGDPDGARSILNEVIEEGDAGQRQEARKLLDDLAD